MYSSWMKKLRELWKSVVNLRLMAIQEQEGNNKTLTTSQVSSTLPEDIITEIFLRLSVACLLRLKSTCKSWYSIITHPDFTRMYSTRHGHSYNYLFNTGDQLFSLVSYKPEPKLEEFDHPFNPLGHAIHVAGTCNGILLVGLYTPISEPWRLRRRITSYVYHHLYLWNPCTKECIELPDTLTELPDRGTECRKIAYGLGYDSVMDDYKVVKVVYFYPHRPVTLSNYGVIIDDYESDVHVYSLRTNSCKKIQDVPYFIFMSSVPGQYFNGDIHWLAEGSTGAANTVSPTIACFITGDEVFREKQLPFSWDVSYSLRLGILDGNLCVYRGKKFHKYNNVSVFMMREDAGKECWTQIFDIKQPVIRKGLLRPGFVVAFRGDIGPFCPCFEPVLITIDRKVLVQWASKHLFLHDTKDGSTTYLKTTETSESNFNVVSYISSLVSLRRLRGCCSR